MDGDGGFGVRRIAAREWVAYRDIRLEMLRDTPIGFGDRYENAAVRPEEHWRERTEQGARDAYSALFVAVPGGGRGEAGGSAQAGGAADRFIGIAGVFTPDDAAVRGEKTIYSVYVVPECRGTKLGVAAALFDACIVWAREAGATEIGLDVHEDNHRAMAFYRRYGFEETGRSQPWSLDTSFRLLGMRYTGG